MTLTKLISGGQTGADRAALDWAIFRDVPHGGWCPKGRKAEDSTITARYELEEIKTANYLERTKCNVIESDGTIIFTMSARLAGGSKRTADFAKRHGKPWLHLYPGAGQLEDAKRVVKIACELDADLRLVVLDCPGLAAIW
jgi:Circularly permutated YpsA SLOG family